MPVIRISEELFREIQRYAEPLVDDFESALWKVLKLARKNGTETSAKREPRITGNLTPVREFWEPVFKALVERGGQASRVEVLEAVEKKMAGELKPGDLALNRDGTTKWSKHVDYQRLVMVHEGLLAKGSDRGIWTITDKGGKWLSEHPSALGK